MAIAFTCQGCSTRFKVSDRLAGKTARCKKCGKALRVPEAPVTAAAVAASGLFRMGTVPSDQAAPAAQGASKPRRSAAPGSLRLAPISADFVKPAAAQRAPAWEEDDSVEYEMEKPIATPAPSPPPYVSASGGRLFWGPGGLAESLLLGMRKVSDLAYSASIALLLAILLAVLLKQRELAIGAAAIVILLNLARFGIDGFVLVTLAFKKGPLAGVLFFVPPLTLYYLNKSKVLREAFGRFLGPALPIIAVVLLFVFVPYLRGGEAAQEAAADAPNEAATADAPTLQDSENP